MYYKNIFNIALENIKNCTSMREIEDYIFSTAIIDTDPTEISYKEMSCHSHFNGVSCGNCNKKFLEFEMYWAEEDGDVFPQEFDIDLFEKVLVKPYSSNIELFWNNEHYSEEIDEVFLSYGSEEYFDNEDEALNEWRLDFYQTLREKFKYIDLFNEDRINECVNTVEIYVGTDISSAWAEIEKQKSLKEDSVSKKSKKKSIERA